MNAPTHAPTPRIAIRTWLAERDMTQNDLAAQCGLEPMHVSWAILSAPVATLSRVFRYRLRIEKHTGLTLWNDPEEVSQLERIGEKIGADLSIDEMDHIRAAAWAAGLTHLPIFDSVPDGFLIFRELIRCFFPGSKTIDALHYKRAASKAAALPRVTEHSRFAPSGKKLIKAIAAVQRFKESVYAKRDGASSKVQSKPPSANPKGTRRVSRAKL